MNKSTALRKILEEYKSELEQCILACKDELSGKPKGTLERLERNGRAYYLHCVFKKGERVRKGITNETLAKEALLKKEYNKLLLSECEQKLQDMNAFLDGFNFENMSFINRVQDWKKPFFRGLATTGDDAAAKWLTEPYATNEYRIENKNIKTKNGIMVRSKSEREIANLLIDADIPFRYEAELDVAGERIYPDFTILRPSDGKIFYWEHAGMIDSAEYVSSNYRRFAQYASVGIFLNENLIMTTESRAHPLSTGTIKSLIEYYFI